MSISLEVPGLCYLVKWDASLLLFKYGCPFTWIHPYVKTVSSTMGGLGSVNYIHSLLLNLVLLFLSVMFIVESYT